MLPCISISLQLPNSSENPNNQCYPVTIYRYSYTESSKQNVQRDRVATVSHLKDKTNAAQ